MPAYGSSDAGRSNGLNFWESAAVTAFGSATWEYFGKTNHPSLNDLIGGDGCFARPSRAGFEVFASQHAAAIGDIQRADGLVPDVIGNFWSLGAALVIR
jgi:hypothetical protein